MPRLCASLKSPPDNQIKKPIELSAALQNGDVAQVENGRLCTACPLCYAHFKENARDIEVLEFSQVYDSDGETET